ncbi:MAG: deoxynucleoside kinase [Candidatus Aminicenantes bacterium]|nr:deoxynucleoside kinase [Candidatus Aminicenantes bacterium]
MHEKIPFKHIAIEGVIKSGKTKLAKIFTERLGGQTVFDRGDNPYLKDFYEEKEGGAFQAQLVYLVNRYHQQAGLLQQDLFAEKVICDYLFEKDKIYAYQTLTDDELIVYEKIFGIFNERIAKPDLVVYLQISLSNLLKRIAKYGTPLEQNISEKYLEDIIGAFDYFFFNYHSTPLFVIRVDDIDLNKDEVITDLLEKIENMKTSPMYYVPLGHAQPHSKWEK